MMVNKINTMEIVKLIGSPLSNATCSLGSIGVDKGTAIVLIQLFTSRLAELLHQVENTGADVFEIAKRQDVVFTNPHEMVELHRMRIDRTHSDQRRYWLFQEREALHFDR